ncbi:hypothetical protein HPP92_024072 [Vanilla planifolia]|uniref:Uncharacterized protein n=1 Tax=Vanilla planifolia TaxID=51239 RepID=A0A835PRA9_VANPL|nr:hypothetical protein HPP92_024072 [Vanilla planifolia]
MKIFNTHRWLSTKESMSLNLLCMPFSFIHIPPKRKRNTKFQRTKWPYGIPWNRRKLDILSVYYFIELVLCFLFELTQHSAPIRCSALPHLYFGMSRSEDLSSS